MKDKNKSKEKALPYAMTLPQWKWMPGMRFYFLVDLEEYDSPPLYRLLTREDAYLDDVNEVGFRVQPNLKYCIPDLNDETTIACIQYLANSMEKDPYLLLIDLIGEND